MPGFNLVDDGWIPCAGLRTDRWEELGLRDALVKAHLVREVVSPSPLATVAIHRLMLAVLHRVFGPSSASRWAELWAAGAWDSAALDAYFDRWRGRFDLFDPVHPFYQTAGLSFEYRVPASRLVHEMASGNNPTLFDHTTESRPRPVSAAEAARYLLAHQCFALGGLVSFERGQDRRLHGSAHNAPLTKCAVALVRGDTLFHTLMLNFHQYSPRDEEPFPCDPSLDTPAWERGTDDAPCERYPYGYLDLLTWQSRRIRLCPEMMPDGRLGVGSVVIMKGTQLPGDWSNRGKETMVAFRKRERPAKGADPWYPVSFVEDRALWRDSMALFQSVEERHARPKMMDWLNDLAAQRIIDRRDTLLVAYYGLSTDRAKVLFWREEQLPLPLGYLTDTGLIARLGEALGLAESVGRLFIVTETTVGPDSTATPSPLQTLVSLLLPSINEGRVDLGQVRDLIDHLAPGRLYWSRLEVPFSRLLVRLAEDVATEEEGEPQYGRSALPEWAATLRRAALAAFDQVATALDGSARALRARAVAEREFRRQLQAVLRNHLTIQEEV